MKLTCPSCGAGLNVPEQHAGKKGKCPKCSNVIDIPMPAAPPPIPPATEKQKSYARELGIDFPADINRREISALIDEAERKDTDDRFDRLEELSRRESAAWNEMRSEVLQELDAEFPRLENATPSQFCEELGNRGRSGIVITFDPGVVDEFEAGDEFSISFTEDMTEARMREIVMAIGFVCNQQRKG